MKSTHVAQVDFTMSILLPPPPKFCNFRCLLLYLALWSIPLFLISPLFFILITLLLIIVYVDGICKHLCVCGTWTCYGTHVEVGGQLRRVNSFLSPLSESQGSNWGHRAFSVSAFSCWAISLDLLFFFRLELKMNWHPPNPTHSDRIWNRNSGKHGWEGNSFLGIHACHRSSSTCIAES